MFSLGGFGLLTALCMGISSSVARGQYMLYNDMRAYFQLRLLYQSLSCDYRVIESEAGQTKYQRAWNSVYFGDFSGTSVMLVACRDIAVNILCFLLYSGILASFSPLLILLLTGLSLLSLLATRRAQVYENSRRNDQAQVERKLRYVVNTGGSVPFGKGHPPVRDGQLVPQSARSADWAEQRADWQDPKPLFWCGCGERGPSFWCGMAWFMGC